MLFNSFFLGLKNFFFFTRFFVFICSWSHQLAGLSEKREKKACCFILSLGDRGRHERTPDHCLSVLRLEEITAGFFGMHGSHAD